MAKLLSGTTIYGNANVNTFLTVGTYVSVIGNVYAGSGNFFIGNGSLLTGITTSAGSTILNGNSNVNIASANANITLSVSTVGNVVVITPTGISVSGTIISNGSITGGNILTSGSISATGNVYAGNTIIIGSETVTGNITSGNVLTGGQVSTVGNITSAANIAGGNLLTSGFISATGNVYALDGIFGSPGTTTVLNNVGVVSAYGNIVSGANIIASGYATIVGTVTGGNLLTSGNVSAIGNATAGNILTAGLISSTGNITGGNILTAGNISAIGTVSAGNLYVPGNANIIGNLNVQGNVTFINSNVITVNDLYIELANNQTTYANINNAGLAVGPAGSALTYWQYNTAANAWTTNVAISATSNVISGNLLTSGLISSTGTATAGNIVTAGLITATGNVYANTFISTGSGGTLSGSGNIIGGNLLTSGYVTATGNVIGGNVTTIGLVSATGNVTGNYIIGNGYYLTGITSGGGGGSNISNGTSNVTVVGANANITVGVSGTGNVVVFSPTGEYVTGVVSATGNITGNYIYGNGYYLTGISGGGGGGASIANGTSNVNISTSNGNVTVSVSGVGNVAVFTPTGLSVTGNVYGNTFISNGTGGGISAPGNIIGGNILTGGYVSATGNVLGNYFIGNGSQLVGVLANVGTFSNGTSNISIASQNANVTVSVSGVGNVAVFAPDSINITGNITATGNIVAGGVRSTSSASAPSNPTTGDFWYNTSTNVQYRFTFDGTNYYWIDDFGATATTQPLFTGPVIFNDVSTQTDGKTGVFALKNNQSNVAGVANSKQLQVTLNGAIQTPFVKTWVWPFWCVDVSFRGFKVTTLGYSATANSVVFYRPPAKGSQVSITQVNTATDSQLLRYPFSATTIAISDD